LSLIRKRSLVRVQAGPLAKPLFLQVRTEAEEEPRECFGAFVQQPCHNVVPIEESAASIARTV
jgi:hypothetical protein